MHLAYVCEWEMLEKWARFIGEPPEFSPTLVVGPGRVRPTYA